MSRIIVIGAGVSGLAITKMLNARHKVTILEKADVPGGMIRCSRVDGHLFHCTGGHVFNTKNKEVLDWFWRQFNKDVEFTKADRNSVVAMADGRWISYPIENHSYQYSDEMLKHFIADLINMASSKVQEPKNFEEFLKVRFGETLYHEYFQPYNEKIWRSPLSEVPLTWLEGKLPMPTLDEIIYNNINHVEEKKFVHSTFFYPKNDGSQFIANRLAQGLDIRYNTPVESIQRTLRGWKVNGEECDKVIFCGNLKHLPAMLDGVDISSYTKSIEALGGHGTTSVLCEVENNPYSWIYMPSRSHCAHRIICTGNFAESNKGNGKMSATIEFTDYISEEDIIQNLKEIPLSPKYLAHNFCEYTYPIQASGTRMLINEIKKTIEPGGLYLLGRFAEWEYYNMDVAMAAALKLNIRL